MCHVPFAGQKSKSQGSLDVLCLVSDQQFLVVSCNISWIWTEYENKIEYIEFDAHRIISV